MGEIIDLKKPLLKSLKIKFGTNYKSMVEYVAGINNDLREKIKSLEKDKPEIPHSEFKKVMEQGSWSAIAKVALEDKNMAIDIAKQLECCVDNIHEFDMEYLIDAFGGEQSFLSALKA